MTRLDETTLPTSDDGLLSSPFPSAAAIDHDDVATERIDGPGLKDDSVLRISDLTKLTEVAEYNECFPELRKSHVVIELNDGSVLESGTIQAAGDPEMPFTAEVLEQKFMRFAGKPLTEERAAALKAHVLSFGEGSSLSEFSELIYQPAV